VSFHGGEGHTHRRKKFEKQEWEEHDSGFNNLKNNDTVLTLLRYSW
jgi:hypothetical protein